MVWVKLMEMMVSSATLSQPVYVTQLAITRLSYYVMVYGSLVIGAALAIEQYFSRHITCFTPQLPTNVGAALGDYCWEHGRLGYNYSGKLVNSGNENFLFNTWVYFFIRAAVFMGPHLVWQYKYEPFVISIIKTAESLLSELTELWLKFSETVDETYYNLQIPNKPTKPQDAANNVTNEHSEIQQLLKQLPTPGDNERQIQLHKNHAAIVTLTKDVTHMTQLNIPNYRPLLQFIRGRFTYEIFFLSFFMILDGVLLALLIKYKSTDYLCEMPQSGELIRCSVPVLRFHTHAQILAVLSIMCVLLVVTIYAFWLFLHVRDTDTSNCFLEQLPFTVQLAELQWPQRAERHTYKIVSLILASNDKILCPINMLRGFVRNLIQGALISDQGTLDVQESNPGLHHRQNMNTESVSLFKNT